MKAMVQVDHAIAACGHGQLTWLSSTAAVAANIVEAREAGHLLDHTLCHG
jgi:hypothetical protein